MSTVARLHAPARRGRFAIHERDRNTFRNPEQCLRIHRGGLVSTEAYQLRHCWDFIPHFAGAEPPAYLISDISLDLEALTQALEV
jgi:hypothetical protein